MPELSPAERHRIAETLTALQRRQPETTWTLDLAPACNPRANHDVLAVISAELAGRRQALMVVRTNVDSSDEAEFAYFWEPAWWNEQEREWYGRGWLLDERDEYQQDVSRAVEQFTEAARSAVTLLPVELPPMHWVSVFALLEIEIKREWAKINDPPDSGVVNEGLTRLCEARDAVEAALRSWYAQRNQSATW